MSRTNKKSRFRAGSVIFWCFYLLLIAAFCVGLHHGLRWLEGWLTDYEAAQPDVKCQQVFDELFANPDWAALYTLAGHSDTTYESAEHYAAYMEEKVGSARLEYHETSAGLSGDHKYIVTLGDEKVATFTLTAEEHEATDIPHWQFASVEIFYTRQQAVTVCTEPGITVYINGVPLSDEHITKTLQTEAESYLKEGTHGLQRQWLYVDSLLMAPQVTAADAAGNAIELVYTEDSDLYTQVFEEMVISQEEADILVNAAMVYCRYMIGAETGTNLRACFDKNLDTYKTIYYGDLWMQDYKSYEFSEPMLSGFYRYSEELYSARLTMCLNVTRYNGTVKEYPLDTTFFLAKQDNGDWLVCDMTNVDVQQQITHVRLQYIVDGTVVEHVMADAYATALTPPAVTAPEGSVFSGWFLLETDEHGNATYSLAFMPDETGNVYLSGETALEPMTLYALFEPKEVP